MAIATPFVAGASQASSTPSANTPVAVQPGEPYNEGSGLGYPNFGKLAADYSGRR